MRALVLCCLVIAALGGIPLASAQSTPVGEATGTDLIVQLEEDGDARWTIETRLPITGPNETQGFRDLGASYVDGDVRTARAPETFERIASLASEETERPMAIENVSRSWRIEEPTGTPSGMTDTQSGMTDTPSGGTGTPSGGTGTPSEGNANRTGVLSYSFTWTNFARSEGNQVVVGDAFDTDDQWLPGLRDGQSLVLRAPENYSITSASVGHTRKTVRWEGPTTFGSDALRATFTSTDGTRPSPNGPVDPGVPISLDGLLAVLAAALLAVVAYGVARRSSSDGEPAGEESGNTPRQAPTAEEMGSGGDPADPFAGVDEDLLSDEERIERHLEAAGGRMKQAEIVDRTGWSNAKVSQVLSQMDEDGRVEKLRIGRENLISLPEDQD